MAESDSTLSILMPVKDAMPYLKQCVDLLLKEEADFDQLIIVDDGSTDGSYDYLTQIKHPKLVINRSEGKGVAAALNTALAMNTSRYVARMDADDLVIPGRFRLQKEIIKDRAVMALTNGALIISKQGFLVGRFGVNELSPNLIKRVLLWRNPVVHPATILDMHILPSFRYPNMEIEDYAAWLYLASQNEIASSRRIVLKQRIHGRNISYMFKHTNPNQLKPFYKVLLDSLNYEIQDKFIDNFLNFTLSRMASTSDLEEYFEQLVALIYSDLSLSKFERSILLVDLNFHLGKRLKSFRYLFKSLNKALLSPHALRHFILLSITLGNFVTYRRMRGDRS